MPRKPRVEIAGGVHHVFARGNAKQAIYLDDRDREVYLATLGKAVVWAGWHCLAYCLMGNHLHLLIETPETNLGAGMGRVHGGYAQTFNRRHRRVGHLFQGRFRNVVVKDDDQLLGAVAYIARNPVEAGLCSSAREWPWSSYGQEPPAWLDQAKLLATLAAAGGDPRRRYDELVGEPAAYDPFGATAARAEG